MTKRPRPPRCTLAPRWLAPVATFVALGSLAACRPQSGPGTTPRRVPPRRVAKLSMEPIQFVVIKQGDKFVTRSFSAGELFARAVKAQQAGRCAEATKDYQTLLKYFARSPYAGTVHFNLALCRQREKKWALAGKHFEQASKGFTKAADLKLALGAAGVNYHDGRRFADARRCFTTLLGRKDLSTYQRIEVNARLGLTHLRQQQFSPADKAFKEALNLYRKSRGEERLPNTYFVGMASYYKAGIFHALFKRTPVRMPEDLMAKDVEALAAWMYKAQRAYWATVKIKNNFWAMAAVYQVGALFKEFHGAIVGAPLPQFTQVRYFDPEAKAYGTISPDAQRVEYNRKLRKRVRILLRHAIGVWQRGLATAERLGLKNQWVATMRKALADAQKTYATDGGRIGDPATAPGATPGASPPRRSPLLPPELKPDRYRPTPIGL